MRKNVCAYMAPYQLLPGAGCSGGAPLGSPKRGAQSLHVFQPAVTELTVAAPRGAMAAFQQLRGACSHGCARGSMQILG